MPEELSAPSYLRVQIILAQTIFLEGIPMTLFKGNGKRKTVTILAGLILSLNIFGLNLVTAQTETVLHNFSNSPDAAYPQRSGLMRLAGSFYGVTIFGGDSGHGVVYKMTPGSNGTWRETIVYSFTGGNDGSYPLGALIADAAGNLYGVTNNGALPTLASLLSLPIPAASGRRPCCTPSARALTERIPRVRWCLMPPAISLEPHGSAAPRAPGQYLK
jgi:uncharacterized repeat protein (TIGR03803 family)